MSGRRRSNGADMAYDKHLRNTPFRNKPQADEQARLERMHLRFLSELSVNRFRWIGLPPEIDPRFVETTLFYNGFGLFFRDFRFSKYVFSKATTQGRLDMYDNPNLFRPVATNYPSVNVRTLKQGVDSAGRPVVGRGIPIWSNYLRMPDLDIVLIGAKRLANLDRTIDINTENARLNKFVLSRERNRLSMDNISREIEQGSNNIKVKSAMQTDMEDIKVLDLGVNPDNIEKLDILQTRHFNKICTMLGIDTSNQDKKERLVADEVKANADQALMVRYVNLQARQQACNKIREIYGLDVWVEYNTEIDKMVSIPQYAVSALEAEGFEVDDTPDEVDPNEQFNDDTEGQDNGSVHDDDEGRD